MSSAPTISPETTDRCGPATLRATIVNGATSPHTQLRQPALIVSLDFELMWGLRDLKHAENFRDAVLGVRQAIPMMLALFRQYEIHATWATVGMLLFATKKELLANLPLRRPTYNDSHLSPYASLSHIGRDEKSDPLHFGLSLAEQVVDTPGQEIGSHTFCHYYCLEPGQSSEQFRDDLQASVQSIERITARPVSLVFPRNQMNADYLSICNQLGITAIRGNAPHWAYSATGAAGNSLAKRAWRLLDAYVNLSGHHGVSARWAGETHSVLDLSASRFLRPTDRRGGALAAVRRRRIQSAMLAAFQNGDAFHLWWHPHNFGTHTKANLVELEKILRCFAATREQYGIPSLSMGEYALRVGVPPARPVHRP